MAPRVALPPGAARWETPNEVAIRYEKTVRAIKDWCRVGLIFSTRLAGGYGGVWVAVAADGVPLDGPRVTDYRAQRSRAARKGALLGAQRSVAVRKARRAEQASRRRASR
jgi:hypothetical protein